MEKLLLCVRYILVIVCFEVAISHGDSCDCDVNRQTFSDEISDLKIENVKLNSRMETMESMLREIKEMQPSLTGKDATQVRLLDEERARTEPNIDRKAVTDLLRNKFSAEKKERRRLNLKIEEGLGRINRSLKEFDEKAKALILSQDVLGVVGKLGNQTDDLVNSRKILERAIKNLSHNVSRMDADINSVIDIVFLDQKAECEPNCRNGGVCFMDGSCRCKPFTEGGHCEKYFCTEGCIENGGECEGPGQCRCPEGQYGYNCEHKKDECAPQPCIHGSCSDGIGEYTCSCITGYSGQNCDTEIDECAPQPCIHGSCSDGIGEYTCSCFTGYSGQNCDTEIDECAPQPCIHGSCSDGFGEYTCSCFTGYSGQNCDTEIDECAPQPCVHGSCFDGIGEYTCLCFTGYNGQNCGEKDECAPQPCIHGSCSDGIGKYTCSCFMGYSGQNCDKDCGETVSRTKESCGENHQQKLSLWVRRVTRISSQHRFTRYTVSKVIGCPDVYHKYGDYNGEWLQSGATLNQKNTIEVEFDVKVNVTSVDIYETFNAGAVTAISGLREDGKWQLLWSTDSPEVIIGSRIFSPSLDVKDFPVSTKNIRVEVDNRASRKFVWIDAIRLHGCW